MQGARRTPELDSQVASPGPTAIASPGKRILAETLPQRGNRVVTNKQRGIRFVFLRPWAMGFGQNLRSSH
jgi:hypothetical protein